MAIANVALTDTFYTWMSRTNQMIVLYEQSNTFVYGAVANTNAAFTRANSAVAWANQVGAASNTWANTIDSLTRSIANTAGLSANAYAVVVGASCNAYTNAISTYTNSSANSTANSANAYTVTVGAASNTYASLVGVYANAYASAVGVSANAYAVSYTTTATNSANAYANFVGFSGNAYTISVAAGANGYSNTLSVIDRAIGNSAANSANAYAVATFPTKTGSGASGTWGISISGSAATATSATSATTFTSTTQNSQFNSLGVGTAASAVAGEIRATNNITAYYSDERLKEILGTIPDPLGKIKQLSGILYKNNALAGEFGYTDQSEQVGVIAQQVEAVLPQIVKAAPFDTKYVNGVQESISGENYKTVQYEKLVPLLIEAIKELNNKIEKLEGN